MDFQHIIERLERSPVLSVTLSIFIVFLTIITLFIYKSKPAGRKNILLLGVSNSGKTSLFCQLVHKCNLLTQISITPNLGTATVDKSNKIKNVELVDVPGQDKIRPKFVDMYKKTARGLIFVIDSSTFHKESKDVAQFLFGLLTDESIAKSKIKVLIVCNKQGIILRFYLFAQEIKFSSVTLSNCRKQKKKDIDFAKSESFIKAQLEKEIELLRKISTSSLKTTDNKSKNQNALQTKTQSQFEFSDLKYLKVEFCEASGLKQESLDYIHNWLYSNF